MAASRVVVADQPGCSHGPYPGLPGNWHMDSATHGKVAVWALTASGRVTGCVSHNQSVQSNPVLISLLSLPAGGSASHH